jgi:hypothetical protein
MKWNSDITGKRINWGDRITRNGLFFFAFLVYAWQFIAPYFIKQPHPPLDPGLIKGLESIVTGIFWFLIGRNTAPAKEEQPPS